MAITKAGVPKHPAKSEPAPGQTPLREHRINRFEVQNPMDDYGAAKSMDPRCRSFGVLGFPDSPEARIGGTLIRKESEEEAERREY